jgi:8-oxo-dGTP diphosphatase
VNVPSAPISSATPQVAAGPARTAVDVAVGVLLRPTGDFLLTSRPVGKVYAGYWEFPGGKLEPGESVVQALQRELWEEIGLRIKAVQPWRVEMVDYPHALVRLNFCKVLAWQGKLQMREAQSFSWQNLPVSVSPVLPGAIAPLQWLAQERGYSGPLQVPGDGLQMALQARNT